MRPADIATKNIDSNNDVYQSADVVVDGVAVEVIVANHGTDNQNHGKGRGAIILSMLSV